MKTDNTVLFLGQNAAVSAVSEIIDASGLYCASVHAIYTGTPSGTMKIQASNERANPVNWVDIGSATTLTANNMINLDGIGYKWIRVAFVTAAGTGSVAAYFFGKGA